MKNNRHQNAGRGHKRKDGEKSGGFGGGKRSGQSSSGRGRREGGGGSAIKFPIYGPHAGREAWLNSARQVHALFVTEAGLKSFEAVIEGGAAKGLGRPVPSLVSKEALDKMLPMGAVHQGVALSCAPLMEFSAEDLVREAAAVEGGGRSVLLMLDQVTDPHNVGAILRSASAFGARGVVMQRKHAPELSGVLAKIATGAVDHMPVAQETNLSRALEDLKEAGYFVIGLDEHDTNTISNVLEGGARQDKIVLVLGSEGDGIRRLVRENCDVIACLPTQGAIQSLNVSNAAAVALYAVLGGG